MKESTGREISALQRRATHLGRGVLILALGTAGAWLASRVRIPAATVLGSMVALSLFRFGGGKAAPWDEHFGKVGRLVLGVSIGSTFGIDAIEPLQTAAAPALAAVVVIIGVGLTLGWILHRISEVELPTALMASVPGGLPAMIAMASDTEADATVVAAVHVVRLTSILLLVPLLVSALTDPGIDAAARVTASSPSGVWEMIVTLGIGVASGLVVSRLGVPSGDLMGPIIAIGGANLLNAGLGPFPDEFRHIGMVLIGASAGARVSSRSLRQMAHIAFPAALGILLITSVGLLLGWGLAQVGQLDTATALLSCSPGGASTLTAIAPELGGDVPIVAAIHFARQLAVFILIPAFLNQVLESRRSGPVSSKAPGGCGPHP